LTSLNTKFNIHDVNAVSHVKLNRKKYEWTRYFYQVLGAELSSCVHYYDKVIQYQPTLFDDGDLLEILDNQNKSQISEADKLSDVTQEAGQRTAILLHGNLNVSFDIQRLLQELKPQMERTTRIVAVAYNPYMKWLFALLSACRLSRCGQMTTFVTRDALEEIAKVSGFELVKVRPVCYLPLRLFGIGTLINRIMPAVPILRWLSLSAIIVFRPIIPSKQRPSLSVVIPARNEAGNIQRAIMEIPQLDGVDIELIFVEGNSTDNTWDEIQKVVANGHDFFRLKALQQSGKGKCDAVRLGFSKATGELLTILDADLTMPPEMLSRFYEAYVEGHADFINGSRLVYPMEGNAMRFLNLLGNRFFSRVLSTVLDVQLNDTLCGTKLFSNCDYQRFVRWRNEFGDFDPFGDFELLFPMAVLGLGSIDIPVRYMERTYGETNISRFRHGLVLLKMTLVGFFRIKLGRIR
jgi:Glycosyl transferase family 2